MKQGILRPHPIDSATRAEGRAMMERAAAALTAARVPTLAALTCNRCAWSWWPRTPAEPKQCPACRSPYWNKQRVLEVAKTAKCRARK